MGREEAIAERIATDKERFLEAYRAAGTIQAAARHVDITRQTIYTWKHNDEEFAAAMETVRTQNVDEAIDTAFQRGVREKPREKDAARHLELYLRSQGALKDKREVKTDMRLSGDWPLTTEHDWVAKESLDRMKREVEKRKDEDDGSRKSG